MPLRVQGLGDVLGAPLIVNTEETNRFDFTYRSVRTDFDVFSR